MMTVALWSLAVAGSALVLTQSSITSPLRKWLNHKAKDPSRCPKVVTAANCWDSEDSAYPHRCGSAVNHAGHCRYFAEERERKRAKAAVLVAKLVSCPMCSGFWFGLVWSYALGDRGVSFAAHGFGGSVVSAIAVALWLLLVEATSALAQWRWQSQKEDK